MMSKKTIDNVELNGKKVVMRVDFNVPIKGGKITSDRRIAQALLSIRKVLEQGVPELACSNRSLLGSTRDTYDGSRVVVEQKEMLAMLRQESERLKRVTHTAGESAIGSA